MNGVTATVAGAASDPESTRIVYGVVIGLVALGVVFVALAVWLYRGTRPDHELLAPLDRMSSRSWRRLEPAERRRVLDAERPAGAQPLVPARRAPIVSAEFDDGPALATLDDLKHGTPAPRGPAVDDPLVIDTTIADPSSGAGPTVRSDDSTGELEDPQPTLFDPPVVPESDEPAGAVQVVESRAEPVAESLAEPLAEPLAESLAQPLAAPRPDTADPVDAVDPGGVVVEDDSEVVR